MAEQIPTSIQEEISAMYFDVFLSNNWDVSDQKYRKLLSDCFGKNGKFPFKTAITLPPTPAGLRNRQEWKDSFEKQCLGLQQYVISRNIPMTGWKWSRGDGMMGFLNDIAQDRCGVSTLDSWNPMDIVGVKVGSDGIIRQTLDAMCITPTTNDQRAANRDILNSVMVEMVEAKKLMPVSLKFIDANERPGFELSPDLSDPARNERKRHVWKCQNMTCDLEWDVNARAWRNAQEISWKMVDDGSAGRKAMTRIIQGRSFIARSAREKPQHEGTPEGAGAKLGKAAITELENFLTAIGVSNPVPGKQLTSHPHIPKVGEPWEPHKSYWVNKQSALASANIGGSGITFNSPGAYGGEDGDKVGFAAALDAACEADEQGLNTAADSKVPAGNRLCAKLWGLEWLST
jgi:hypothetical protein